MKNYPLIKFTIFFILGIILQHFISLSFTSLFILSTISFLITLLFSLYYKNSSIIAFFIILTTFSISALSFAISNYEKANYPFEKPIIKKCKMLGDIESINLLKSNGFSFEITLDSLLDKNIVSRHLIRILVRVYEDDKIKLQQCFNKIAIGNKIEILGKLSKPMGIRNPGDFDYATYLAGKGIAALATVYNCNNLKIINKNNNRIDNYIFNIRKILYQRIVKLHSAETSGLLKGLILADRSSIDYEQKTAFVNAGVVHVLAVSGLHVGFIILICIALTSRFNLYIRSFATILSLLGFLLITGAPISVFRASLMATVAIIAFISGRSYNGLNSLALAALILLIINPADLFNPGFQLSFSAVASILIMYPFLKSSMPQFLMNHKYIKGLTLFCLVSLSAQIGTLPFTLIYFHKLSLISLVANIVVIPLIGVILAVGITTLFFAFAFPIIAQYFATANDLFTIMLYKFVSLAGGNFSFLRINNFSLYDSILFYIIIGAIISLTSYSFSKRFKIIIINLLILVFFQYEKFDNHTFFEQDRLSVLMIDVGQGDSFLVMFPNGKTALIDAGNRTEYIDSGSRIIIPLLNNLGIDKIDYGFISHMDSDHYGGFYSLINENYIKNIYKPKPDSTLKRDLNFEKFLFNKKVHLHYYSKTFLDFGNSRLYILSDTNNVVYNQFDINNRSGIFKLDFGKTSILFTGDIEQEAEHFLVKKYNSFLHSDILKAPHHGSITSSTNEFLKAVSPRKVLISAGLGNKFKHPSKSIIKKYNNLNLDIYRTDMRGAILLQSDGSNFTVIDWRGN